MTFFLRAKAWQVFLILMAAASFGSFIQRKPGNITLIMFGTVVLMLVWMGWMWAIASESNKRLEPSLQKSPMPMAFGIAFAAFYLALVPWLWPDLRTGDKGVPALVFPMHLGSMLAIFYALVFTANRLTTLERNQRVTFFDYAGPFFLFWFFPLGVWFIQPRVNRLLGNDA